MDNPIVSTTVVQLKSAILMDQVTDLANRYSGLKIYIDCTELANRYIANLNAAETVIGYEGGRVDSLWNDQHSVSEIISELQLVLWEYAMDPSISDMLTNHAVSFLNEVALCVYERSIANQSGMHYSFKIGERLSASAFTLLEMLPGEVFIEYMPGPLIKQYGEV